MSKLHKAWDALTAVERNALRGIGISNAEQMLAVTRAIFAFAGRFDFELKDEPPGSDDFLCCGGSDEHPPEHTRDCPDRDDVAEP